jgi:predicted PurR-regulated permease PerM
MQSDDQAFVQRSLRRLIVLAVSLGAVLALLWVLKAALTPLVVAFVLAYLLDPVIDRLELWRLPRPLAILLLLAVALVVLLAVAFFVIPRLQRELVALAGQLPGALEALLESVAPLLRERFGVELPGSVREGVDQLRQGGFRLPMATLSDLLGQATGLMTGTLGAVVGAVVIPVIAFYLLVDFDRLKGWLLSLVPRPYVDSVVERVQTVDRLVAGFIRGQLTVCLLLGVLYAVGFALIGVDLAVLIGLASGLLAFIPYVGGAVALLSASGMCLLEFGFDLHLVLVVGWYAFVQSLEGFVLTPRIVGESLGLHPVTVIVALMIGGDLLGFLGLLVAVPGAAVVQVFVGEAAAVYRSSSLYTGSDAG